MTKKKLKRKGHYLSVFMECLIQICFVLFFVVSCHFVVDKHRWFALWWELLDFSLARTKNQLHTEEPPSICIYTYFKRSVAVMSLSFTYWNFLTRTKPIIILWSTFLIRTTRKKRRWNFICTHISTIHENVTRIDVWEAICTQTPKRVNRLWVRKRSEEKERRIFRPKTKVSTQSKTRTIFQ